MIFSELEKILEEDIQEFEANKGSYKIIFKRFSEDSGEIRYVDNNGLKLSSDIKKVSHSI